MSLEYYHGKRFCSCDECGEELKDKKGHTFTFANDEFDVFRERFDDEGWALGKNEKDRWTHTCPDCQ